MPSLAGNRPNARMIVVEKIKNTPAIRHDPTAAAIVETNESVSMINYRKSS
jgi:hypothetical protein